MFAALLFGPFLLLPPIAFLSGSATLLRRDFLGCPPGIAYNAILLRTFLLELWFAGLLSAGALLAASHG